MVSCAGKLSSPFPGVKSIRPSILCDLSASPPIKTIRQNRKFLSVQSVQFKHSQSARKCDTVPLSH